ncbi:MAG: hypothetical protein A3H69_03295 [Candidatus Sungbacteria bacterium RIFCSPLOWO2_02_FULL_47_9]|uniref:Glucokinase n=2 Tax=Parcubacteria group TaxID=1794811 RepID=A0A1G2RRM6_9BACT|nr:MAG: hypothetical protein UX72_C0003G0028 [Parcubacteria group bacterium GW2011_GWA2_47_10]OGZ93963.1 MAG: hypothetical protein A2633_00790 [Candidatus Sungbacteria bacterium RIFCSPHIGHO2_01_FULL_47_32]OHA10411.1 MAG: hypothetical protein A3H69_03295 [Candidatus Sungbacteria bacterium RIFCSPLOWO2_02_FULL_47_9]OHA74922.1 MAG: hypothetical protein A3A32_03685 [Candidatus Wildermuthbacteria bacterium RIFCSPLOWO2_01_FULL_48_35]
MNLLFDIGGTKTRLAVSRDSREFDTPKIFETPKDFSEGIQKFKLHALELLGGGSISAIAGGIAGPLNKAKTGLVNSPHLPDWAGHELTHELERIFAVPVYLENDSAVVGLGEAMYGAGTGSPIVAYMTVSTGVGGVRIVNGKIDANTFGFEPGHQIIDAGGVLGVPGTGEGRLEEFVSGSAIENRFHKLPIEMTDPDVCDELARMFAIGLHNTILHWSPDTVVLGGSLITGSVITPTSIRKHLLAIMKIFTESPHIREATLGDLGGLWGSLELIRQKSLG